MAVIGDMLGVLPGGARACFLKWSDDLVIGLSSHCRPAGMTLQVTMDAFIAYNDYTLGMIEERRAEPTDDLISRPGARGGRR